MQILERKKTILFVCIGLLLAAASSPAQTASPPSTLPLLLAGHGDFPALPGLKISWYSGLDKKMVMMRVENVSGKNINAYNISIGMKYADGSTDYSQGFLPSAHMETLPLLPVNGMEMSFAAGATSRDQPIGGSPDKEVVEVVAVPDVIVYTDDTAEVRNEFFFKQILASRKGELLALQQMSEMIKHVLADGAENPTDAAIEALTRMEIALRQKHSSPEEPENNEEPSFQNALNQLQYARTMATQRKLTEREYLAQMADDFDKQAALLAPHCEIKRLDP